MGRRRSAQLVQLPAWWVGERRGGEARVSGACTRPAPPIFRSRFTSSLFQGSNMGLCLCQRLGFGGSSLPPSRRRGSSGDVGLEPTLKVGQKGTHIGVQQRHRCRAVICGAMGDCISAYQRQRRACDPQKHFKLRTWHRPRHRGVRAQAVCDGKELGKPRATQDSIVCHRFGLRRRGRGRFRGWPQVRGTRIPVFSAHTLPTCTSSPQNNRHSPRSTAAKPRTKSSHRGGLQKC